MLQTAHFAPPSGQIWKHRRRVSAQSATRCQKQTRNAGTQLPENGMEILRHSLGDFATKDVNEDLNGV